MRAPRTTDSRSSERRDARGGRVAPLVSWPDRVGEACLSGSSERRALASRATHARLETQDRGGQTLREVIGDAQELRCEIDVFVELRGSTHHGVVRGAHVGWKLEHDRDPSKYYSACSR